MTGPYDDIALILAEHPPGAFRRLVDSWPAGVREQDVLDGLESAGIIRPLQRQLAHHAVERSRGLPHFAAHLAMRLDTLNLTVDWADDPALEAAANVLWARR